MEVHKAERIAIDIGKPVPPSRQSQRIRLQIAHRQIRIVGPMMGVVQPRLFVVLLAGVLGSTSPKPLPGRLSVAVGQASRCVEVVGMKGQQFSASLHRNGHGACCGGQVEIFGGLNALTVLGGHPVVAQG